MSRFIQFDRNQQYLLPPSVDEWLPEDHLARFIVEVIDQLDLSKLTGHYSGRGSAAYHPALLLALLVYGYATGTFSSRKIERATYDSVAFRFIAANHHPDHDTLAHFRKTFLVELEDLFVQVLTLAQTMKLVKLGQISLDGTKIKANASKHKALSHGHIEKLEAQLREEVQALLKKAVDVDQEELADGIDLPAEVARREDRLKALAEAKAKIAERVKERDEQAQKDYQGKLADRERQRQAGKKPRGQEPKAPETGPKDKDQINLTDEESRIMPSKDGFVQGYNAQAAVDVDSLLVVGATLSQHTNDKRQVEPMLKALNALPDSLGKPETLLADNGYFSKDNIHACVEQKITPLIALGREAHHLPLAERLTPDTPEPESDDPLVKMAWKLKTQSGRALYGKRKSTVEPVFGIIKQVLGFRQFSLRGLDAVAGEWKLVTMAFNLKRMHMLAAG
ncbi:IS1182 family transposase [Methylobacter sp. YRD-M1]|uniref:IS1182 family transposase n=1 Tax=Methylobacter sp. YRD-M1 TaxID=2911520 RepID=UPI00227CE5A9|nr:IS1182 family transposase [Methylobacter sp. YRD-M1]WAK00448.1 IS1182 family transposase [Methylobacter sp. YRD-M1]WAK00523.1 IS1182 family transposase [Methylobacter sp. YRD-M1]WAK00549.1 IS1182 family transposase [Methylobacter sp. YRD-M1]WAK00885.1 IS1182 family transposase [Methylobacter sp. YRD-M1]WAK00981.1 IS1182 family transposase [Methylobacter sp. YRD-M1]